jgi:hypothetical protein
MSSGAPRPDPNVRHQESLLSLACLTGKPSAPVARRPRFSDSETRRLLAEADSYNAGEQLSEFLRRERTYSSMLASWCMQMGNAELVPLTPRKRAPKADLSAGRGQ